MTATLTAEGFSQSKSDYALFTKRSLTGFTIVLTYVNDLILARNNQSEITQLKSLLHNKFGIKNLGPLRFFLGFEIARSSKGFSLNQRKYALDLLQDIGLLASKPLSTPMDYSFTLFMAVGSSIPDASIYRRLLGRLVYLTNSKPDISFDVSKLSQFLNKPSSIHLQPLFVFFGTSKEILHKVFFFPLSPLFTLLVSLTHTERLTQTQDALSLAFVSSLDPHWFLGNQKRKLLSIDLRLRPNIEFSLSKL